MEWVWYSMPPSQSLTTVRAIRWMTMRVACSPPPIWMNWALPAARSWWAIWRRAIWHSSAMRSTARLDVFAICYPLTGAGWRRMALRIATVARSGRSTQQGWVSLANTLFIQALPAALSCTSPRAWAFTLLGIDEYLKRFSEDRGVQRARDELAGRFMRLYEATNTAEGSWFEDRLTYDNAASSRALLLAGVSMRRDEYVEAALTSLTWLAGVQAGEHGQFVPIGCLGFYRQGEARTRFDQQPIEAYATIAAYLDAFRATGDAQWRRQAARVFGWFLGDNDLGLALYDAQTGACCDGLQPDRENQNQGAESTLAFLLASLELRLAKVDVIASAARDVADELFFAQSAVAGSPV